MRPHLGPLSERSVGGVHRVVAFVDRVDQPSAEATVATATIAGIPVDLAGGELQPDRWACLDVTEAPRSAEGGRRMLTVLTVVDTCDAAAPEWAARRDL